MHPAPASARLGRLRARTAPTRLSSKSFVAELRPRVGILKGFVAAQRGRASGTGPRATEAEAKGHGG
jgi:hypothetical protein